MGRIVCLGEVCLDLLVGLLAVLLVVVAALCLGIAGIVGLLAYLFAQLFVVDLIVVLALHVRTAGLRKFFLHLAHRFDGLVRCLQSADEVLFGNLVHLTLYHHDVVLGGTDHEVHVCLLHLLEGRIDDVFAVDTGYADFGGGVFDRDV